MIDKAGRWHKQLRQASNAHALCRPPGNSAQRLVCVLCQPEQPASRIFFGSLSLWSAANLRMAVSVAWRRRTCIARAPPSTQA